jgi:DNA polymerase
MSQHDPLLVELGLSPLWVSRARADALARSPSQGDAQAEARTVPQAENRAESRTENQAESRAKTPAMGTPVVSTPATSAPATTSAMNAEAAADTGNDSARANLAQSGLDRSSRAAGTGAGETAVKLAGKGVPEGRPADVMPFDESHGSDSFDAQDDLAGYETVMFERVDFVPPADFELPAEPSTQPSVATLDFAALRERVASCTACGLCAKRTQTVFGVGDEAADWMIVGEAPGENEDRLGEPFVGQAGKLLDNMLRAVMLNRTQNVYIANVIKCRPPGNRNPQPDEVARCEPYLKRQVALVRPKLILALGRFAAQTLLKSEASISSLRGRVHHYEGVPVIVSYHPAYLLRSLPEKSKAWADLCLAQATFRQAAG